MLSMSSACFSLGHSEMENYRWLSRKGNYRVVVSQPKLTLQTDDGKYLQKPGQNCSMQGKKGLQQYKIFFNVPSISGEFTVRLKNK